jgi:hypothetical protein
MAKLLTSLKRKLSFAFGKSEFLLLKTEYVGSKKGNTFFIDRITHVKTRYDNIKVLHHKEQTSDIETLSIPADMKLDLIIKGSHYSTYSVH